MGGAHSHAKFKHVLYRWATSLKNEDYQGSSLICRVVWYSGKYSTNFVNVCNNNGQWMLNI